jgi:hypothetical protein
VSERERFKALDRYYRQRGGRYDFMIPDRLETRQRLRANGCSWQLAIASTLSLRQLDAADRCERRTRQRRA